MSRAPRPQIRRGQREDADMLVRLIDLSSHGGIGEHYRQLYGENIDWRHRARLEIAAGGPELGYQNAVIIMVRGADAGGMILNALRSQFVFTSPPASRAGQVERLIASVGGTLFIRELAIFPSFRRQGLARHLIAFARDFALASSLSGLSLTVNADNGGALGLYETEGFIEIKRVDIDGRPLVLMQCPLQA